MRYLNKCTIIEAEDIGTEKTLIRTAEIVCDEPEKIYLLDQEKGLWHVIERLIMQFEEQDAIVSQKFAYNINCKLHTELCKDDRKICDLNCFADFVENVKFTDKSNLAEKYHIIVDDGKVEDEAIVRKAVADLFQQTVLLGLNVDIVRKSEIKNANIRKAFRRKYKQLLNKVQSVYKKVNGLKISTEEGKQVFASVKNALETTVEEMEAAAQRPIRIAVMATKKAGKSVIVNSLIGDEYAPTSLTLPTPNCIRYIPDINAEIITLKYGDKELHFIEAKEIKKYILEEFKKAQAHTGEDAALPDMIIRYPSTSMNAFEVWDTPGPDFAGAGTSHRKIAEACIKNADVCIFVEDFTKNLQDSSIDFLKDIKQVFEENDKFYSLFIAINKVDQRFTSSDDKSIHKIIDYIREKLNDLGYANITTFGTSALDYFYLGLVKKLLPVGNEITVDDLRAFKKENPDDYKKNLTQLKAIKNRLTDIEDYMHVEDPNADDVAIGSGMPHLIEYTKYIGEQKADMEIVNHVLGRISAQMQIINNALLLAGLNDLTEQEKDNVRKLQLLFNDLGNQIANTLQWADAEMNTVDKNDLMIYRAKDHVKDIRKKNKDRVAVDIRSIFKENELTSEDIKNIAKTSNNEKKIPKIIAIERDITDLIKGIYKGIECDANSFIEVTYNVRVAEVEGNMSKTQKGIDKIQKKFKENAVGMADRIQSVVDSFNLRTDIDAKLAISLPQSTLDVQSIFTVAELRSKANSKEIIRKIDVPRPPEGLWESILSMFGKSFIVKKEEVLTEVFIKELAQKYIEKANNAIDRICDDVLKNTINNLKALYHQVEEQISTFKNDYEEEIRVVQNGIKISLNEHTEEIEALKNDMDSIASIREMTNPLLQMWDQLIKYDSLEEA